MFAPRMFAKVGEDPAPAATSAFKVFIPGYSYTSAVLQSRRVPGYWSVLLAVLLGREPL